MLRRVLIIVGAIALTSGTVAATVISPQEMTLMTGAIIALVVGALVLAVGMMLKSSESVLV